MPPKERFSSLCGKAVKKPVVMGFWPHCVALMAASPSLGLKGDFSAERDHSFHWRPSPRLKSGANPSLVNRVLSIESCQSSLVSRVVLLNCQSKGAGGRPAPFDLDGGAWT